MPNAKTHTVAFRPDLHVTLSEQGTGRPALILHGGGGPSTVAPIANHLAGTMHPILPTHPGWNSNPRPENLSRIGDIADAYLEYLHDSNLNDVLVIGSSLGGWMGVEMAVRDEEHRISGLILINAVGIEVEGEPIRNIFALNPREMADYAFHDADRFYVDPATLSPEQVAVQQANAATVRAVAGDPYMVNPTLFDHLISIEIPVLVVWGDSDRIASPAYGAAYARAFPNARFEVVRDAGHLPHLEQPAATFSVIDDYVAYRK